MGIEKLTGTQTKALNMINILLFSKRTLGYSEFLRLINDAGYEARTNGGGHMEIQRKSDKKPVRYESGLPVIISKNSRDFPPGKYEEILKVSREEIECYD